MAIFQRLPESLQDMTPVFRKFVQEENTVMSQTHFPGAGSAPTTHQTRVANRVVGCSERTAPQ